MKSNFTKITFCLFALMSFMITNTTKAQTTFNVSVNNFSFTNADITISVGDSVKWTNSSGFHNVNGTTTTFPLNPESFGNSEGTSWTFIVGFTIEGTYNYQCDVHGPSMSGTVTVVATTGIDGNSQLTSMGTSIIYPVPANEFVQIDFSPGLLSLNVPLAVVVYDMMGREVLSKENITDTTIRLNTNNWSSPLYIYHFICDDKTVEMGKILVQ